MKEKVLDNRMVLQWRTAGGTTVESLILFKVEFEIESVLTSRLLLSKLEKEHRDHDEDDENAHVNFISPFSYVIFPILLFLSVFVIRGVLMEGISHVNNHIYFLYVASW